MLIDPFQLDLELLGRKRQGAKHAEAARPAHRRHHITTVAECKYGELDAEQVTHPGVHYFTPVTAGFGGIKDRSVRRFNGSVQLYQDLFVSRGPVNPRTLTPSAPLEHRLAFFLKGPGALFGVGRSLDGDAELHF